MIYKQILFDYDNIINNDSEKNIEKYFIKEENYISLYALEGNFIIYDKKVYICFSKCIDRYEKKINNVKLYINHLREENKHLIHFIPMNCLEYNVSKKIYKMNKDSNLEFVIEKINGLNKNMINYYFILRNNFDLENPLIKEEFVSFFNLLN